MYQDRRIDVPVERADDGFVDSEPEREVSVPKTVGFKELDLVLVGQPNSRRQQRPRWLPGKAMLQTGKGKKH